MSRRDKASGPQDATPDSPAYRPEPQDALPVRASLMVDIWRMESERDVRAQRTYREQYDRANPEQMAVDALVSSQLGGSIEMRTLYAARAAAWASLAVLKELKAQGAAGRTVRDAVPEGYEEDGS